ncbi:hypothetical protein ACWA5Z_06555 [Testudinibacter sp. P80/BLE/0925]
MKVTLVEIKEKSESLSDADKEDIKQAVLDNFRRRNDIHVAELIEAIALINKS